MILINITSSSPSSSSWSPDACKENSWETHSDMVSCIEDITFYCRGMFPKPSPVCGIYNDQTGELFPLPPDPFTPLYLTPQHKLYQNKTLRFNPNFCWGVSFNPDRIIACDYYEAYTISIPNDSFKNSPRSFRRFNICYVRVIWILQPTR